MDSVAQRSKRTGRCCAALSEALYLVKYASLITEERFFLLSDVISGVYLLGK